MAAQPWYKRKIDSTAARLASGLVLGALVAQWLLADTVELVIGAALVLAASVVFIRAFREASAATGR